MDIKTVRTSLQILQSRYPSVSERLTSLTNIRKDLNVKYIDLKIYCPKIYHIIFHESDP